MKGPTISKFDKVVVVVAIIALAIICFYLEDRALRRAEKNIQLIVNFLSFNIQQGRLYNLPQQPPVPKPEEKPKEKK